MRYRQSWRAVIGTGFNGDLELPLPLQPFVNVQYVGRVISALDGGQRLEEDAYLVDFPFDGETIRTSATFVDDQQILIGTHLLRTYQLIINFVQRIVELNRE